MMCADNNLLPSVRNQFSMGSPVPHRLTLEPRLAPAEVFGSLHCSTVIELECFQSEISQLSEWEVRFFF